MTLVEPVTPDFVLRDAQAADVPALARLHVQAFDQTHGRGPDARLREQQWRAKFASPANLLFCLVLEDARGELIGFASGEPNSDGSEFAGVLDKIYLLREYHRRGLGRRLLCAAAERFRSHQVNSMLLFGDAHSPTNGFYEAMGGVRLYTRTGEFHGGYGWTDLGALLERCRTSRAG